MRLLFPGVNVSVLRSSNVKTEAKKLIFSLESFLCLDALITAREKNSKKIFMKKKKKIKNKKFC